MKTAHLAKCFLAVVLFAGCQHAPMKEEAGVESHEKAGFQLREFETQTLPNGLKIIWVKDAKLPIVSLAMAIRSGGSLDPKGKEGLADMTAALLNKGVPGKNAIAIADHLEQRADAFAAQVDADATYVGIRGLSFHDLDSLKDFYELVVHPTFPKEELERTRKLTLAGLERISDRPGEFTNLVFSKVIFGSHPYAHDGIGTPEGISHIGRSDVLEFHKNNYSPDRATLAVVGQFDDQYKKAVIDKFSAWKKSGVPLPQIHPPIPRLGFQIVEVEKPELQQTEIRIGHLGVKRNIPDHIALKVATWILGDPSSFSSLLWNEIRVKRGLTYGVHAYFDQRVEPGAFEISTFTRNDKIHEMVEQLLRVFKEFHDKGVSEVQVEQAKSGLKARFPHLVETGDDVARQLLILDLNGVSYDYLKTFQREIEKVTTAQVNRAITEHFHPENLKVVVFGPTGNKGMESLKDFGPLKVEDYKKAL